MDTAFFSGSDTAPVAGGWWFFLAYVVLTLGMNASLLMLMMWLFHRRWGRNPRAMTRAGERIRHITVGGRTTAWVPTRQH